MQRIPVGLAAAAVFTACGAVSPASAQNYAGTQQSILQNFDRGRNVSVLQRDRPEYSAAGLPVGAFTLFPKVTAGLSTNSNVYAIKDHTTSDSFYRIQPSLDAYSSWTRNQAQASVGWDILDYFNQTSESRTNWYVNGAGRFDVLGDSYIQGGAEVRRDHIERSAVGFPTDAGEPIPQTATNVFGRGVYQAGRIRGTGMAVWDRRDYSDVSAIGGGRLDQDGRDVDIFSTTGRADYAASSSTAVFGQGSYRSYKYIESGGPFERNSHEIEGLVGANFDATALARGEVGIGYIKKEYDDARFRGIKGLSFNGRLEYFPTQLTTVTLTGRRAIEDSILSNTGGYISTAASLRVDHELRRNVLLAATASLEDDDFRGADRKDRVYGATASGRYLVSRGVGLGATFSYNSRQSSGALRGPEYDITQFGLSLVLQR